MLKEEEVEEVVEVVGSRAIQLPSWVHSGLQGGPKGPKGGGLISVPLPSSGWAFQTLLSDVSFFPLIVMTGFPG